MSKATVVSQAAALSTATNQTTAHAVAIADAAIGIHKAGAKLSKVIQAAFALPAPLVSATLSEVFAQLDSKVNKGKPTDASRADWATIANSVATHVRNLWNKLPEDTRPALCYIALNRADCNATVHVMQAPSKQELKNALANDTKALNAALARIHGNTPNGKDRTDNAGNALPAMPAAKGGKVGAPDPHAPASMLAGVREQIRHLSSAERLALILELSASMSQAERHEVVKGVEAQMSADTVAKMGAQSKAARKTTANAKVGAKSRGEAQRVAMAKGNAKSGADIAPTDAEAGRMGQVIEITTVPSHCA